MKRIFLLFLVFLLLTSIYGCHRQPVETQPSTTQTPTPDAIQSAANTAPHVTQQPMVAVSMPIVTQNYTADNGDILVQHTYQNLELIVPDQDVADAIIIDYLNRTDKAHASAESLYAEILDRDNPDDRNAPYLSQITFQPTRLDQSIFSLLGNTVTHKGYAHPEVTAESVTYDLVTGEVLAISDVLNNSVRPDLLYEKIIASLQRQANDVSLYEDYEKTVSALLENPTNWYFSENGLVFYYSPYEIAPYASGIITAEIEYANLTGMLNDAYFPAESDIAQGQLQITAMESNNQDRFSQIAEVVCSESANLWVLYTDGLITNIRIRQQFGNGEYTVFASPQITPGDGIVIYLSPTDTLQVYYTANGEPSVRTLQLSSDGIPQLIE